MTLKALKGCVQISYEAFLRAFRRALVNEKLSWFQAHLAEALQRSSDAVALAIHLFLDPNTVKPLNPKDKITIPVRKLLLQVINPSLCNGKSSINVITPHLFIHPRHFHVVLEFLDNMAYSNDPNAHISAKHLWLLYQFFPADYRPMFIEKIIECTHALSNNPRNPRRIILAAKITIKFQLHYNFKKEDLLFPLIRFKKQLNIASTMNHVFDYITSAPEELLEELQVSALSKIADPKGGNDPGKAFQKLLEWGLGIARFPKIIHYRRRAALQWLIKIQRHMEFLDFISDDRDLLIYLCKELQAREKQEDVERICRQFHLNFNYNGPAKPFREQLEPESKLPILSMESYDIRWVVVDTLETLALAQKAILRENVVGLDTESLPIQIFHPSRAPPPVQIFQIGTRHCAYLFDLNAKQMLPHFFSFLECLFSDVRIIKVGMNFQIDLRELRQQYPIGRWNTKCFFQIRQFLELMDLKPVLLKTAPKAEPSGRRETGLEKIFRHVMGIGLDKTCQISNWARRPLTNAQISYAAIDAAVPVMIYQALCKRGCHSDVSNLLKDFSVDGT